MSLLTIVQRASALMSLVPPITVVGSADVQVRQLYSLANEEGQELARDHDWQVMRYQREFLTSAGAEQVGAVPEDLDHFISNSFNNRTTRLPVMGPITPQQYQAILNQGVTSSVYLAFIERTGQFLMTPTPPAGQVIAYEYISQNWVREPLDGALQAEFTSDNDVALISERLITLGVRWRFLSAKGLDYAEALKTYEREKQKVKARDGANTVINAAPMDPYSDWWYGNGQGDFPGGLPGFLTQTGGNLLLEP